MKAAFILMAPAIVLSLLLTPGASATSVADTVSQWGLIGTWALDCAFRPDKSKGIVLVYAVEPDGRVVHRRDYGNVKDENEVVAAEVSADGMLNLQIFFSSLDQTREFGMIKQPDGTMRAIYNRNPKGEYTIRDGLLIASGKPTLAQHKCR